MGVNIDKILIDRKVCIFIYGTSCTLSVQNYFVQYFLNFMYDRSLSNTISNQLIGLVGRVFTGRPGFNPRSHHTKDFKNGT